MEYPKPTIRFENPNGVTTIIAPREDGECAGVWFEGVISPDATISLNVHDVLEGCEQDPNAIPGEYEFIVAAAELVDFLCDAQKVKEHFDGQA